MADVDMADAAPAAPAKTKASAKGAKAGGSAELGSDGKKRFEVKKVGSILATKPRQAQLISKVECSSPLGMGHRRR